MSHHKMCKLYRWIVCTINCKIHDREKLPGHLTRRLNRPSQFMRGLRSKRGSLLRESLWAVTLESLKEVPLRTWLIFMTHTIVCKALNCSTGEALVRFAWFKLHTYTSYDAFDGSLFINSFSNREHNVSNWFLNLTEALENVHSWKLIHIDVDRSWFIAADLLLRCSQ